MARTKKRNSSKAIDKKPKQTPFHAFWSGSLSFGLVNVPVLLFPASRYSGIRLRMLSPGGSLLERRFFCPRDGKEVADDEIVRGFELDDGSYITVEDRELEALEPEKTREIDLREFVDLAELPPMLFERGYYLTPQKDATKAYRLLADVMERTRKAGIATFVMREREYLIAIFARDGILCALTMRFHDEIREPSAIGLPEPGAPERRLVSQFERAIDALSSKTVSEAELADRSTEALRAIIEKKRKSGRDIVQTDQEAQPEPSEPEDDVDLLATIRRSLRQTDNKFVARRHRTAASPHRTRAPKHTKTKAQPQNHKPGKRARRA